MKERQNGNKSPKRSIRSKILITLAIPVIIIFIVAQFLILILVKEPVQRVSEEQIKAETKAASYQISEFFTQYIELVKQMANNVGYSALFEEQHPGMHVKDTKDFAQNMDSLKRTGQSGDSIHTAWIADIDSSVLMQSDGAVTESGWVVTERPYYAQVSAAKDVVITEPYQDALTQSWIITILKGVYNDKDEMIGITCVDIEISKLDKIMASYSLGENGYFALVTPEGVIMHHQKEDYMSKNIAETSLSQNIVDCVTNQDAKIMEYKDGSASYMGCVQVVEAGNWSVISGLPVSEYNSSYFQVITVTSIIFLVCATVIIVSVLLVSRNISGPVKKLAFAAQEIADGKMEIREIPDTDDEIGMVSSAFGQTVNRLREYMQYIEEITETLNKIAEGKLNYSLRYEYTGEFAQIKEALLLISESLNETMAQISKTAEDVAATSGIVSDSAKELSVGTESQKNSILAIQSSIAEVEHKLKEDAEHASMADEQIQMLGRDVEQSNVQMQKMLEAMEEIRTASNEIETMVEAIQGISGQTNMLSLNASIEAARAGEAGRGFAVVANTVGDLAGSSAEAAKTTEELLQKTLRAVENGTKIADETASVFAKIVERTKEVVQVIDAIFEASSVETDSIRNVAEEMNGISEIVEQSRESASASSETSYSLSGQAQLLKELLKKFEL